MWNGGFQKTHTAGGSPSDVGGGGDCNDDDDDDYIIVLMYQKVKGTSSMKRCETFWETMEKN